MDTFDGISETPAEPEPTVAVPEESSEIKDLSSGNETTDTRNKIHCELEPSPDIPLEAGPSLEGLPETTPETELTSDSLLEAESSLEIPQDLDPSSQVYGNHRYNEGSEEDRAPLVEAGSKELSSSEKPELHQASDTIPPESLSLNVGRDFTVTAQAPSDTVDTRSVEEQSDLNAKDTSERLMVSTLSDTANDIQKESAPKFYLDGEELTLPAAGEREYQIGSPQQDFEAYKNIVDADRQHHLGIAAQTTDSFGESVGALVQAQQDDADFAEENNYVYEKYGHAPYTDSAYSRDAPIEHLPSNQERSRESNPPEALRTEPLEKSEQSTDTKAGTPINSKFTGQNYDLEDAVNRRVEKSDFFDFEDGKVTLDADKLIKDLKLHDVADKYPNGVQFDLDGYPDFSPYAASIVQVDNLQGTAADFDEANEAAGLPEKPRDYTWHHHQDGKTMMLVPTDLHSAVRHTGGASILRRQNDKQ